MKGLKLCPQCNSKMVKEEVGRVSLEDGRVKVYYEWVCKECEKHV